MPQVQTVTGPVDADALGLTLVHEHFRGRDEATVFQWPHVHDEDEEYAQALEQANAVLGHGVKTVVEPTAMMLGRDVPFSRRLAQETGLQLVACTGIYTYEHLPINLQTRDADYIAGLFVHDIEQGIQGTDARAAFIKVAADEPGVTDNIEKLHRAAARASLQTGAPIMAHSRPASNTGPAPGRGLPRGGRRPGQDPDRAHRRHRRPRLHRGAARKGRLDRPRPLRHRDVPAAWRTATTP